MENEARGKSVVLFLLHELLHIPWIAGNEIWHIGDTPFKDPLSCRYLKNNGPQRLNPKKYQPADNVDRYLNFIQWAWVRAQQQKTCLDNWPLWNVLTIPEQSSSTYERTELRKLLVSNISEINFLMSLLGARVKVF